MSDNPPPSTKANPSAGTPTGNTPRAVKSAKHIQGEQENGSQFQRSLIRATEVMKALVDDVEQMKIDLDTKEGEMKKLREEVAELKKPRREAAVERRIAEERLEEMRKQMRIDAKLMQLDADSKDKENKKLRERVAGMDERIRQLEARMDTATPGEREAVASLDELSSNYLKKRRMI